MTTKKIDKIIIYYNDGTFEEIKTGVHDMAPKQNKDPVISPGEQDVNKYTTIQYPPGVRRGVHGYDITCGPETANKYTIATSGIRNVDFSRDSGREFT